MICNESEFGSWCCLDRWLYFVQCLCLPLSSSSAFSCLFIATRQFFPEELLIFNMQILHSFFLLADKVIKSNFAHSVFKQVAVWHKFSEHPRVMSREHCVPEHQCRSSNTLLLAIGEAGGRFDSVVLCNRVIRWAESGTEGKTTV